MTTPATRKRRPTYRGERRRLHARVPVELADLVERQAAADRRSVSDYLGLVLERALLAQEAPPATP